MWGGEAWAAPLGLLPTRVRGTPRGLPASSRRRAGAEAGQPGSCRRGRRGGDGQGRGLGHLRPSRRRGRSARIAPVGGLRAARWVAGRGERGAWPGTLPPPSPAAELGCSLGWRWKPRLARPALAMNGDPAGHNQGQRKTLGLGSGGDRALPRWVCWGAFEGSCSRKPRFPLAARPRRSLHWERAAQTQGYSVASLGHVQPGLGSVRVRSSFQCAELL